MDIQLFSLILVLSSAITIILSLIFNLLKSRRKKNLRLLDIYRHDIERRMERVDIEDKIYIEKQWALEKESSIEKRKTELQKKHLLKNFYYINDAIVELLYNQMPPILEPKEISIQKFIESQKGGSLSIPIAGLEGKKTYKDQITELYQKKEPSLELKFKRLLDYLVKYDYILLGLEEFEYNKYIIDSFEEACKKMNKKFNFALPQDIKNSYISNKMNEFALENIEKIRDIQDVSMSQQYIMLTAKFIPTDIDEKFCRLQFKHPLNEYLLNKENEIQIQIDCIKEYTQKRGLTYFNKNEAIPITCLGSIINLTDNVLKVEPIAIY